MCMEYEAFAETFKTHMEQELGKAAEVSFSSMEKLNAVGWEGLAVRKKGEQDAAVLSLRRMYQAYREGGMGRAAEAAFRVLAGKPDIHIADFPGDWEKQKGSIRPVLVSAGWNEKLLTELPHRKFLDLAVTYRLEAEEKAYRASTFVKDWFLKHWGITEEELWEAAMENLTREEYEAKPLTEILEGILGTNLGELFDTDSKQFQNYPVMYVLTNRGVHYGAAGMLREDLLKAFSEQTESSFYILPSSVHETILVAEQPGIDSMSFKEMVSSINEGEVEQEEWLSESVYYYDREKGEVRMAE